MPALRALGAVAVALAVMLGTIGPGSAALPSCPTSRIPRSERLGRIAYVRAHSLHVVDLATCRDRVLARQAGVPVRFSPDGRWIAFGRAKVVSSRGGSVTLPLGKVDDRWSWSPTDDLLAAVRRGGVVVGGPGRTRRLLVPRSGDASHVKFDPSGRRLAVEGPHQSVWVVDVRTGDRRVLYRTPKGTFAPPIVAGWSPDQRWVLFWPDIENSASLASDGMPLMAVPVHGGRTVRVVDGMLLYDDFLSSCGNRLAIAAGLGREVNVDKRIVVTVPPRWELTHVSHNASRSWYSPACSPDGSRIAVTSTHSHSEPRFGTAERTMWILDADGSGRRLVGGKQRDPVSEESPRWSSGGRWLLFVRRARRPFADGRLFLLRVGTGRVFGPVARLPGHLGYYGHYDWTSMSDWYQPA